MKVSHSCIWNYWKCVETQLSWWGLYLETYCHCLENSCLSYSRSSFISLITWITSSDLLLPSALTVLLLKRRARLKGFLTVAKLKKNSFELFLDFTDSVKWSLISFPKRFLSLICSNSTLFFSVFFASWGERTLERTLYLRWY